jgi:hypothetical protein
MTTSAIFHQSPAPYSPIPSPASLIRKTRAYAIAGPVATVAPRGANVVRAATAGRLARGRGVGR